MKIKISILGAIIYTVAIATGAVYFRGKSITSPTAMTIIPWNDGELATTTAQVGRGLADLISQCAKHRGVTSLEGQQDPYLTCDLGDGKELYKYNDWEWQLLVPKNLQRI
jgi:hypothetical protein